MIISQSTLGIDVSAKRLDVYVQPMGKARGFSNDPAGMPGC